jgi:tetraprenyl-beta-curcumene synthase
METRGALRALTLANARYWPTVAPEVRRELAMWRAPAATIPDHSLRELALTKLSQESFNAEVAATLATLATPTHRTACVRAIVALELLFDYLDGRTELPAGDSITHGLTLFGWFTASVNPISLRVRQGEVLEEDPPDAPYLSALAEHVRRNLEGLPGSSDLAPLTAACVSRCAGAQVRLHACATLGEQQLQEWAMQHGSSSGLGWREYIGGCASSVLSMHALIAAAGKAEVSIAEAERLDAAYLAIGAVVTMLDSLVDDREDRERGERGFIRLYADLSEMGERLREVIRVALARAQEAPNSGHHTMTLAGVAAYYTTHPGAREPGARQIATMVRRELSPTIWPTLGVMRSWRLAKAVRARAHHLVR